MKEDMEEIDYFVSLTYFPRGKRHWSCLASCSKHPACEFMRRVNYSLQLAYLIQHAHGIRHGLS
jgi:hypothetical protein